MLGNPLINELIGGVILALIGFISIWFLRPKVKISPNMAKKIGDNDKNIYSIKVINSSYIFQLLDIRFELTKLKPETASKGMNIKIKTINLKSDHIWFLSRRKGRINKLFSKNDYATYAIIIDVVEDACQIDDWKEEAKNAVYYDLKVISKNNFSGITSINHEKFSDPSCIEKGKFEHGNTTTIKNND